MIGVITTVHNAMDTRIYYKEIQSLRKRYVVEYYAPMSKTQFLSIINSVKAQPLYAAKRKIGRIKTHLSLLKIILQSNHALYHLHDPELIPLGFVLKFLKRKIVIFDMHENLLLDISTKNYILPYLRKFIYLLFVCIYSIALKKFDYFILAEDSYKKIMPKDNHEVIYNFPIFKKVAIPIQKKFQFGLVYVGSITMERGIWNMLKVFKLVYASCPESSLHLIGPIDEPDLDVKIAQWISDNSLAGKIYLYGRLPNEEIYDIIKNNSVGLCLLEPIVGFQESFPTKMFEYMMSGIPVVASNFRLWQDVVEETHCGIVVDPNDYTGAARVIVELLKNEEHMKALGKNGMIAVKTKYNWCQEDHKLLRIYNNLLNT